MMFLRAVTLVLAVVQFSMHAFADNQDKTSKAPEMSKETRMQIVRAFNAELVYIRAPFPMGKIGLTLKEGQVTPKGRICSACWRCGAPQ